MSVCAPADMDREQVERLANIESPTGLSRPWKIPDKPFSGGESNPNPCDNEEGRLHYLLCC